MKIDYPFSDMSTAASHSGGNLNAEHAHLAPIYATSTFTFDSAEQGMNRFTGKEEGLFIPVLETLLLQWLQKLLRLWRLLGLPITMGILCN